MKAATLMFASAAAARSASRSARVTRIGRRIERFGRWVPSSEGGHVEQCVGVVSHMRSLSPFVGPTCAIGKRSCIDNSLENCLYKPGIPSVVRGELVVEQPRPADPAPRHHVPWGIASARARARGRGVCRPEHVPSAPTEGGEHSAGVVRRCAPAAPHCGRTSSSTPSKSFTAAAAASNRSRDHLRQSASDRSVTPDHSRPARKTVSRMRSFR